MSHIMSYEEGVQIMVVRGDKVNQAPGNNKPLHYTDTLLYMHSSMNL